MTDEQANREVQEKQEKKPFAQKQEDVVFVGNKGVMSYVLAVITEFNNGCKHVSLKARGKSISRAVDTAEIIRNRFLTDVKVVDIKILTEQLTSRDGNKSNVSAIEITLAKQ